MLPNKSVDVVEYTSFYAVLLKLSRRLIIALDERRVSLITKSI